MLGDVLGLGSGSSPSSAATGNAATSDSCVSARKGRIHLAVARLGSGSAQCQLSPVVADLVSAGVWRVFSVIAE